MDLIVVHAKILKRDGTPTPVRYLNATHQFVGDLLVVEYDAAPGKRAKASIPREHVVQIVEEP